jgi:hypothetical protein
MTINELIKYHTELTEAIKQKSVQLCGATVFRKCDIKSDLHLMHINLVHIEDKLDSNGFKGLVNGRWVY